MWRLHDSLSSLLGDRALSIRGWMGALNCGVSRPSNSRIWISLGRWLATLKPLCGDFNTENTYDLTSAAYDLK